MAVSSALRISVAALIMSALPATAAEVIIGQTLVVNPGDYPATEAYTVNGGTLDIRPGVSTGAIRVNENGLLLMDGGNAESGRPLFVSSGDAIVSNSSISSPVGFGVGSGTDLGAPRPSNVTLINSNVSGVLSGVNISGGGVFTIASSIINGVSNPNGLLGYGVLVQFGRAEISSNSLVTGEVAGLYLRLGQAGQPTGLDTSAFGAVIDGSRVVGRNGPAIEIRGNPGDLTANVVVKNGAELISGNGNILEALNVADLNFSASNSVLRGNIVIASTANALLAFTDNAILNGVITGPADTTVTNGATWNLTGDSSIGDLTLGAAGTVKLGDGTAFNTLNVNGDFVGQGGTFVFNSVFGDDSSPSDKVVIAGNSAGTGNIVVNNINGAGAQTGEGIQLISVAGSSDAAFVMPGRATAGIYEYLLYKGGVANPNDGAWYLRSTYTGDPCDLNPSLPICAPTDPGTPVDPVAPVIPVDPIDPGTPIDPIPLLRPEPGAYLANQAAAVRMFQQRRHDRGEPAFEHDRAGAWARVGRDQMHTTIAGQVDTRTHTNVLQIGSDIARWGESGRGQIGLMLATGEAETQATSRITGYGTRGKVKGDAVGLYGTWVQSAEDSSGLYVDGWLQYGRYDNRVQGDNLPRETYDATTRAASIEAGYGWAFANAERGTWYLQPQAQVTYTDYKGDTLQEVNGTVVEDDRAGGFESRVGVRLFGHDSASGNRVQPFLAVNWLYTERGDAMRFDGERLDARLPTNRYEAQAGAQLRLGQNWSAWGDLRVQRGDSGYKDAGAQLGLRRAW